MSGSDAYKGGGTQAERRAYWALFWERQAIISGIRLKQLQGLVAQTHIEGPITIKIQGPPVVSPHAYDHAAGMRPMSGTVVTERTVKRWPSGTFPKRAMR